MLLKTSNATDYSGVPSPLLTPRPAVEFLQTVTLVDYQAGLNTFVGIGGASLTLPSIFAIDAPQWANFKRYKRIQFSIGAVGSTASDTLVMNTRRNGITYSATKIFTRESITATTSIVYTNTSSSTAVELCGTVTNTTGAVRQLDIFLTQIGGSAECFQGDTQAILNTGNISRTNFTIVNNTSSALPGYIDTDVPGIQLGFASTAAFRPPRFAGAGQLTDYVLECNIYGWLR